MCMGQSSSMLKTQRNKNMKHFQDLQHKPNTEQHETLTNFWKNAQKLCLIVFDTSTLFNYFSFFFTRYFVLLFNLPLAILSLLCAPSFFILYIIYLFENLRLWLHFDCLRCRVLFIWCWMKTDAWCFEVKAVKAVWDIPKRCRAGI